ncbi:MAG TPA: hypothetical protein VGC79_06280 [Polyangiaceae bacterium]
MNHSLTRGFGLRVAVLCALPLALGGCSAGASADPGLNARLRLAGAQFVPGPSPAAAADGPEVASVELPTTVIWPGLPNKALAGALGPTATAAAVALSTDTGYWVVPARAPDVSAPTLPTFRATASFSPKLAAGAYTLEVRAVDGSNHFGAPFRQTLTALAASPAQIVTGALVITLTWDTASDLDLHVIDPLGNEIFHGAPSSGSAFSSAGADESNGALDHDSNADCVSDGLRQEDVTWADAPPAGHYLVRVDTASLCQTANAHWWVKVLLDGAIVAEARGISLDTDTWGAHDRGAGLLALGFDLP